MSELLFECREIVPDPHAAAPTLLFRLRIEESTGLALRGAALRCQVRIVPEARGYNDAEAAGLEDLFGERDRWPATARPLQFAAVTALVPAFRGRVEFDLAVPCSYDLEVACGRYFQALEIGEVPLVLLFSGTLFTDSGVEMVPWSRECAARMPVKTWRELMDGHFPDSGWLRLRRETLAALTGYRNGRALPGWDETIRSLIYWAEEADGGR